MSRYYETKLVKEMKRKTMKGRGKTVAPIRQLLVELIWPVQGFRLERGKRNLYLPHVYRLLDFGIVCLRLILK